MIHVLDPKDGECIIDPLCGTGIILSEGFRKNKKTLWQGDDCDRGAISLVRERFKKNEIPVQQWDARDLPLPNETIDGIVTNLPFGKEYSSPEENKTLYRELIRHWTIKLQPQGRMVLLTADTKTLEPILTHFNLPWSIAFRVKVLGQWANAYLAQKRNATR